MACKGICTKYRVKKKFGGGWYDTGAKRCNTCELYVMWDGIRCPCCNSMLRTQPTTSRDKEKLRIRIA